MTAPSTTELMRRIDDIVMRLDRITASLEEGYVRKDVYASDRNTDAYQLKGFEDELHLVNKRLDAQDDRAQKASFARWSIGFSAIIGPILVVVILHAMGLITAAHK